MPPKKPDKKAEKGQQKALEKQKQKVIEDKTFGLKNKNKSKAVQKYIKGVAQQAMGNQKGAATKEAAEYAAKEEKKKLQQQAALLNALFRGTENVKKITVDDKRKLADPKQQKLEQKIDLYQDQREQRNKGDTMEYWTIEKLQQVISDKHGAANEKNETAIVCKHFLDAVERKQYGWFWTCPGGGDQCKYRHCLPPGYVLKRDVPVEANDDDEDEPMEEIIERQRAALPSGGTKVTLETFRAWKQKKEDERLAAIEAERQAEANKKGNRGLNVLTGRDLFAFDPTLFVDDDQAASEEDYEEDQEYWDQLANENQAAIEEANRKALEEKEEEEDEEEEEEEEEEDEDEEEEDKPNGFPPSSSSSSSSSSGIPNKAVDVNRADLFLEGDVPDDLDALDD